MKIEKYRNSKWLRKADVEALSYNQRMTEVEAIEEELVGDEIKPICHLKGIQKPWPINMTGLATLAEITGSDETDDYVGTKVEIYVDPNVLYAGKKTGGIKLRARQSKQEEAPLDDAIPF